MLKKDKKNLMGCIETVMNKEKHQQKLYMIASPMNTHKNSIKHQNRQRFLTEWSHMHAKAKVSESSVRNREIQNANVKIIDRLLKTPLNVPKHTPSVVKCRSNSEVNRMKKQRNICDENQKIKSRIIKAMSNSHYSQKHIHNTSKLSASKFPDITGNVSLNQTFRNFRKVPSASQSRTPKSKNFFHYTQLMKLGKFEDLSLNQASTFTHNKYLASQKSKLMGHCASIQRMRQAAKLHLQKKSNEKVVKGKVFNSQNLECHNKTYK